MSDHAFLRAERNIRLLCDYAGSILRGGEQDTFDEKTLDEPYRRLGRVLALLYETIERLREREELLKKEADLAHRRMETMEFDHENLRNMAFRDPVTGIYNRLYFQDHLELALREREDFTLCYLDLDGLKYVNDCFGHSEGDDYIRRFVEAVQKNFRSTDLFARIGGDEFCLLFLGRLKKFAERKLLEVLREFRENVGKYPAGFSFGVVEVQGNENILTTEEILESADVRMYEFKRKNRERYQQRRT